jgi:phosphoglycolate phosphatase
LRNDRPGHGVLTGPWTSVLFDLDGTLADTAPDLGYALNLMRLERGLAELPVNTLRAHASSGARGLLFAGFGIGPDDPDYEPMREQFLDAYERNIARESRLFPGIDSVLRQIEARGMNWGIVTNKVARFTVPLLSALGLRDRAACVICGDTTPHAKPHPAPLFAAAAQIGESPEACIYVGDDLRDVQAAQAAGMAVAVARYGYLGNGTPPEAWGADLLIDAPEDLVPLLFAR